MTGGLGSIFAWAEAAESNFSKKIFLKSGCIIVMQAENPKEHLTLRSEVLSGFILQKPKQNKLNYFFLHYKMHD